MAGRDRKGSQSVAKRTPQRPLARLNGKQTTGSIIKSLWGLYNHVGSLPAEPLTRASILLNCVGKIVAVKRLELTIRTAKRGVARSARI
jgi:hypothetical protein